MTIETVLLGLILVALLGLPAATAHIVEHRRPAPAPEPVDQGITTDELAAAIANQLPAPRAATDLLDDLIAHRYVVTLVDEAGNFGGVLTDVRVIATPSGKPLLVYILEQCQTLPETEGETPRDIAGRVIIDSSDIAYLQQIG